MSTPTPNDAATGAVANSSSSSPYAVFAKFDSYPWGRDRPFLQGLVAMIGPLSPGYDRQSALGISLQARIWWYKSRFSVEIDRAAYETYLCSLSTTTSCPDPALLSQIEEIQQRMASTSSTSVSAQQQQQPDLPAWQLQAPKVDPGKKAEDGVWNHHDDDGEGAGGGGRGADAPYPAHFQAIVEAVTMGKPVPGVREIPNTVVRQPGITPVGKMQAPQKPWERTQQGPSTETNTSAAHQLLNQFPPVLDENQRGTAEATS